MSILYLKEFDEEFSFQFYLEQEVSSINKDLLFLRGNIKNEIDVQQYYFIMGQLTAVQRNLREYLKNPLHMD